MNAFDKMTAFNKVNPEAKEVYRKMQQWQVLNKPENGVFCPIFELSNFSKKLYLETLAKKTTNQTNFSYEHYRYANELQLFGAWRNSLGIYKIDSNVIDDVIKSLIPSDTPVNIFERLPEWCVYFDVTNSKTLNNAYDGKFLGFWALFDHHFINKKYERVLKIILNIQGADDLLPIIELPVDNNKTIEKSLEYIYQSDNQDDPFLNASYVKSDVDMLRIVLSMLLWLCAEEPDISNILGEPINKDALRMPKYRINKKTGVFIPPDKPIVYNIGHRLGGEIRTFNERISNSDSRISARKRPHIRRGHWHGVWSGTGQNKEFKIYWQSAIFVNAS